jgi:hypothetical protein
MLRSRLNPRGLQQIASLLEWQQLRVLGAAGLQHQLERTFGATAGAAAAADKSVQYARERKAHGESLSELRKQWAEARTMRLARQAAREDKKRLAREALKAQKAQEGAAAREARMQELVAKQAEDRQVRVRARLLAWRAGGAARWLVLQAKSGPRVFAFHS